MNETESQRRRRRWITFGELIALAALLVSAAGVWISWKGSRAEDQPTRIVEQRPSIPLTLRARRQDDGAQLEISPVESTHVLESLTIKIGSASPIAVGSDGELQASEVAAALAGRKDEPKNKTLTMKARVEARYVEAGRDRSTSGTYTLRYQWRGGGLFGGRTLRLMGLSRG